MQFNSSFKTNAREETVGRNGIFPKVLIVEDHDVVSDCLQMILRAYDYDPLLAANTDQAIERCRREHNAIFALIVDVRPGKSSGFQTAQMLQRICPGIRVIFTSGYPYEHLVRSGLLPPELGTAIFLQKPFLASDIRSSLQDFDRTRNVLLHSRVSASPI
jgi:DNA-binding NtrC family response regulator